MGFLSQPLSVKVHLPLHLSLFAGAKPTLAKFLLCRVQEICPLDLPSVGVRYFQLYPAFHLAAQQAASATAFCPLKVSLVRLTLIQHVTRLLGIQSSLLSYFFEVLFTKIKVIKQLFYPNLPWEMGLTEEPLSKKYFNSQLTSWLFQILWQAGDGWQITAVKQLCSCPSPWQVDMVLKHKIKYILRQR